MAKVADAKPMDIRFDTEEEQKEFQKWANDSSTAQRKDMVEMRRKIREARQMRKRMRHGWQHKK